jgi:hypothetical protein
MIVGHHTDTRRRQSDTIAPTQIACQALGLRPLRVRVQLGSRSLPTEVHGQDGFALGFGFVVDLSGLRVEASDEHAGGIEIFEPIVEFARRDGDGNGNLDIERMKISVGELNVSARTDTKVNCVKKDDLPLS